MKKLNLILLLVLNLICLQVLAAGPLREEAVPGGIAVVKLATTASTAPYATFQQHRVKVVKQGQHWYAWVGIPLSTQPGVYTLDWQIGGTKMKQQAFTVKAKSYPKQYLTIKNQRQVSPNPQDLTRIQQEQVIIDRIKKTWTPSTDSSTKMIWPLKGRISSEFGLQRFFNQQPRAPHAGLDIAAPTGTPIQAPMAGQVVATANFFFSGNTVYLDHGQGLISMYAHLSEIKVKPGQTILQGQVIGKVGQTGRATGPHLHWGVMLNTAYINPGLLLKQ